MTNHTSVISVHTVSWRSAGGLLVAFFFIVVGAKLLLIASLGNPTPFWDQWDGEAAGLYLPYLVGDLGLEQLFASHNEHRIVVTRLYNLVLLELAGEWNPMLQMVANAVLHAAILTWLVHLLLPLVLPARRLLVVAVAALVFALPIGWENTLGGFQSQFYFLILFSLVAVVSIGGTHAFSLRWFAGIAALCLAYFSLASGVLAAFAISALCILQITTGARARTLREIAAILLLLGFGAALLAFVTHVPGHDPLRAHSIFAFISAVVDLAALPYATIVGALVVQAPVLWLMWQILRARPPLNHPVWIVLGIAGLVGAQMLSLAYGRGTHVMGSRYFDLTIVLFPLNLVALFLAADWISASRPAQSGVRVAVALWVCGLIGATSALGYYSSWRGALERGTFADIQQQHVVEYLATGDIAALENKPPLHIPYPQAGRLADLLDAADLREILPKEIRPPDADVDRARQRLLLRGELAAIADHAVRGALLLAPAILALGVALMFALGASSVVVGGRGGGH